MISYSLTQHILTIGCKYAHPKGGIAVLLSNYSKYIFTKFNFVANSSYGSSLKNLLVLIASIPVFIFKLIFNRNIKLVHIHTASNRSFMRSAIFVRIAHCFHKKVLIHIHGGRFMIYYNRKTSFVEKIINKCDGIITLSTEWESFFKDKFPSIPVYVLENVIAPPEIIPTKNDDVLHLLYLGLITRQKGIYDLLEVISENHIDLKGKLMLHIAGNGETEQLTNLITNRKLNDCVKYEGWVNGLRKTELLNACDVFILPSYNEGLPISILEAMSYRKPIISTPVGGIPSVVDHEINGILFTPGDHTELKNALNTYINNPQLINSHGDESAKRVAPFLPENVANKLSAIYENYLN